ncbi:MAG TPA: hypothetical protein VFG55_01330 [Rhodanobacteraceae bacterium]|nr:hypothetical protein [Rhodanobacteraceae bacterium]
MDQLQAGLATLSDGGENRRRQINAVTGGRWVDALNDNAQDYVVVPEQPWLDGFNVTADVVRQFVAAPLGEGLTAEGQLTGEETWGGVQLIVYPMKAEAYRRRFERPALNEEESAIYLSRPKFCRRVGDGEMGLAAGGRIRQTIKEDPYGLDDWDTSVHSRCFVHLLNSERYREFTGHKPPSTPVTARAYARARIPWFDYYSDGKALPGAAALARLDSIASALFKKGSKLEDNSPIVIAGTIGLGQPRNPIRDGVF